MSPQRILPPGASAVADARAPGSSPWKSSGLAVLYIGLIGWLARETRFDLLLFPELGALAFDIFWRPNGTWARAPLMLVVTPFLAGTAGIVIAHWLPYGVISVTLAIAAGLITLRLLKSPIAPALSAGLLPVALGVTSWWYPPALLVGTGGLALIAIARGSPATPRPKSVDDRIEAAPVDGRWWVAFVIFLAAIVVPAGVSERPMLLFPPLVVMAFEMFGHSDICPWAKAPWRLPLACFSSAAMGIILVGLLGQTPLCAALMTAGAIAALRIVRLHAPPVVAVSLLPMVITAAGWSFVCQVSVSTLALTLCFLTWQRYRLRRRALAG